MNSSEIESQDLSDDPREENGGGGPAPGKPGEPEAGGATESSPGGPPADDRASVDTRFQGEENGAEEAPEVAETGSDGTAADDESGRLREERDRYRDRHLRLAADFDNFRKRAEDRLARRWDNAQADFVSRLLDPLDDLLRVTALEPESASVEAIVEGVDLVQRKFLQVLEEAGVEIVDPLGETFDPNTMEAMMRVSPESDDLEDTVERVFQRGYAFRGRLVRPARVSVYKG